MSRRKRPHVLKKSFIRKTYFSLGNRIIGGVLPWKSSVPLKFSIGFAPARCALARAGGKMLSTRSPLLGMKIRQYPRVSERRSSRRPKRSWLVLVDRNESKQRYHRTHLSPRTRSLQVSRCRITWNRFPRTRTSAGRGREL